MISRRKTILIVLLFIVIILSIMFLIWYKDKIIKILYPFCIAIFITYLVTPLVKKLERKNFKRSTSILLIYLFFSLSIVSIIIFIIPELINNTKELINTLPSIVNSYQGIIDQSINFIQRSNWPVDIKNTLFREFREGILSAQNYIISFLKNSLAHFMDIITAFFDVVLAMIIAYYFIKDAESLKTSALSLVPRRWRNGLVNIGRKINMILSNFIQGQIMVALIIGVLEIIGLLLVKAKYPIFLGILGGIANIIPYFGPIIGAIPAVAVALIESPVKAIWTAAVFVIVQQIDNAFISPKIVEGKLGLHPVTTILAILVGGEFFGIIGMILSVPITAILKVVLRSVVEAIV